jgi:hypothetical protein
MKLAKHVIRTKTTEMHTKFGRETSRREISWEPNASVILKKYFYEAGWEDVE